jgi:hypothetical protein
MAKTIEKLAELEYNELVTLGMMEQYDDLREIFTDEIKVPFTMLYSLQKEGKLNDQTKELLVELFENLILTSKDLINKYQRLMQSPPTPQTEPIAVAEVVEEVVEPFSKEKADAITTRGREVIREIESVIKKESVIPRRYGKEKITKDIEAQGGVATPVQRAMLKVNDLKNIYVNLSTRGIKDMIANTDSLSDEDCRKIVSAITTFERQMADIVKTKAKKK